MSNHWFSRRAMMLAVLSNLSVTHVLRWLLIVSVALQSFAPALAYAQAADASQVAIAQTPPADTTSAPLPPLDDLAIGYTPADLPNGVGVTIRVAPAELPAGGTVIVSGQGAPGGGQVRVAVVSEGKMLGVKDVLLDADNTYSAELPIDATYPPGPVQLCALGLGLENAEVGCVTLVITPPANGSVSGRLPLNGASAAQIAAIDAEFRLMNAAGKVLYTSPVLADGRYKVNDVAPGLYLYAVAGLVPTLSEAGAVNVRPIQDSQIEFAILKTCGIAEQIKPTTALTVNPSRAEFTRTSRYNGLSWVYSESRRPFGLFVTGVENMVTFTAAPQATGVVDKVVFEFVGVDGNVIDRLEDSSAPYEVRFNVGRLPASKGSIHPTVTATPVVAGKLPCGSSYDIEVMGNPMSSPFLQPLPNSRTVWDSGSRTYQFEAVLPYVPGKLPATYSLGSAPPFFGEIKNEFNTGVFVKGYFDLEGKSRIFLAEVFADATLLSLPLLAPGDLRETITPAGFGQIQFDIRNPAHMAIPYGPLEIFQDDLISIPFDKILIFTYFGIVNAYVAGSLTFGVGLYLEGVVRPLAPALDSTLSGVADFRAELGLSVDLLLGVIEGGAGLGGQVCVYVPLRVLLANSPNVYFDNPFVGGRLYLVYWASAIWGLVKSKDTAPLKDFGPGCPGGVAAAGEAAPPAPDVFRSPAIVASSEGRVLAAYVENTALPGAIPQVQIMARFQNEAGDWSEPQALSNPLHSAKSPSAAFVGPNDIPMVVWSENTLTAEEAAALGDEDLAAHLRHQEIFYAFFNGDAGWGAPVQLTDDELADGLPEAAGSSINSVIAWTTDTDGDAGTRGDQRIAVSTYDQFAGVFPAPTLLELADGVLPAGGLNNDVAVAMDSYGNAYVAWVHDLDADLTTGDDRRLEVAYGIDVEWTSLNPQPLPPRVDSPSITVTPDGVQVAFLVREPTSDGEVGLLGTNGALWTALLDTDDVWRVAPVLDTVGATIYAEEPTLAHAEAEALLVFRRFDDKTARGALGQISMSRLYEIDPPTPPVYLTDASEQQWLAAIAINPVNNRAIVVHSALAAGTHASVAAKNTPLAATQALPATAVGVLLDDANPVLFMNLENQADPALDPMQTAVQAPAPNSTIYVTVKVRNVGRWETGAVTVSLYRGQSDEGVLVNAQLVAEALDFGDTATLVFEVPVPDTLEDGGRLSLYAKLQTGGENLSGENDATTLILGGLSAPSHIELAGENPEFEGGLDMTWSGNVGEYITGYRILRADTATGPWALVGESAVPSFTDTSATFGQTYCYVAVAYNDQGAFSPRGPATCAPFDEPAEGYSLYAPMIQRR